MQSRPLIGFYSARSHVVNTSSPREASIQFISDCESEYSLEMAVELPYSLHNRHVSIAIAWTVILIPPVFINLGLFYGLWYGKPEMDRLLGEIFYFQISI